MRLRWLAFRAAGILWLLLGVATILTIFGTLIGIALAVLVGLRQSVIAARIGTIVGVGLLLPGQLILEMAGCDQRPCGTEPYLLALGLPALVIVLNGIAGWTGPRVGGHVSQGAPTGTTEPDIPPGQQPLWNIDDE